MSILSRRRTPADRFSAALAGAIRPTGGHPAGRAPTTEILGLEHEFTVRFDGRPVDFRRFIHRLPINGRRLDPVDPDAYRCAWGGTITADGPEAEIAISPVAADRDGIRNVVAAGRRGRAELQEVLPAGATLRGFSTHLSVAVPDRIVDRAARLYRDHFAAALALLLDGPESPGLLVRPRFGRLELCGEFAEGELLAIAAAFALGSARAVARAARWRGGDPIARHRLPPRLAVTVTPAVERYGWFVGDAELGAELHVSGRSARLLRVDGRFVTAGEHLVAAWRAARRELDDQAEEILALVDAAVDGRRPVGVERQADVVGTLSPDVVAMLSPDVVGTLPPAAGPSTGVASAAAASASAAAASASVAAVGPLGSAIREHIRPGFRVEPAIVSWDFVVLRLDDGRRQGFACLPRRVLGDALVALDDGRLDLLLSGFLTATDPEDDGRILTTSGQTAAVGLYRGVGTAAHLLGVERPPAGPGSGKRDRQRRQDRRPDQASSTVVTPATAARSSVARQAGRSSAIGAVATGATLFGMPAGIVAAAAGTVAVVVVAGAVILGGGATHSTVVPSTVAVASTVVAPASIDAASPGASAAASPVGVAGEIVMASGSATVTISAAGDTTQSTVPLGDGSITDKGEVIINWDDRVTAADGSYTSTAWLNLFVTPDPSGTTRVVTPDPGVDMGVSRDIGPPSGVVTVMQISGLMDHDCTVTTVRTATGGINGTVNCTGRFSVPPDPYQAAAIFWAEPAGVIGPGGSGLPAGPGGSGLPAGPAPSGSAPSNGPGSGRSDPGRQTWLTTAAIGGRYGVSR